MDEKSPLSGLSQGKTFILGIVAGILVLCTIGFFILLAMQFGDGGSKGRTPLAVNTGTTPSVTGDDVPTDVTVDPVTDDDHIRGNEDAKITLVEYSDFQCPYCSNFEPTISQALENYPDDIRVVYRHFPLRSIHPEAANAANAAECAAEQGKFWEYHDALFANQASLGSATYSRLAKEVGLNTSKFDSCFSSMKYEDVVQADEVSAQNAGGRGTPYSILIGPNGETIPVSGAQPYSVVDAAIQQLL